MFETIVAAVGVIILCVIATLIKRLTSAVSGMSAEFRTDIADIKHELSTNDGSSLKDAVNDMCKTVRILDYRMRKSEVGLPYWEFAECGSCEYANKEMCDLFGMSESSLRGSGWLKAVADQQAVDQSWQYAVKSQIPWTHKLTITNQETRQSHVVTASCDVVTAKDDSVLRWVGTAIKD